MEIVQQILNALIPIAVATLSGFIAYVANKIKAKYDELSEDKTKKVIVDNVVKFVEQTCKDLKGEEKLKKAVESAQEWLSEKGISVTDAELNILIEAAVNEIS